MIIGDVLVQTVLRDGLITIAQNTTLLEEIGIPDPERNQMAVWLQANQSTLREMVILGYPDQEPKLPLITILLAEQNEADTPIGDIIGVDWDAGERGVAHEVSGTMMRSTWRAGVIATNANLCVWLSSICKWILLRSRTRLYQDGGLFDQRISQFDFEPTMDYLPVFTFRRGCSLAASHYDTYTITTDWPTQLDSTFYIDPLPNPGGGGGLSGGGSGSGAHDGYNGSGIPPWIPGSGGQAPDGSGGSWNSPPGTGTGGSSGTPVAGGGTGLPIEIIVPIGGGTTTGAVENDDCGSC